MRSVDPKTGRNYVEKCRRRSKEPGQPRELAFSCFRRFRFLERVPARAWFRTALQATRAKSGFPMGVYVLMPEQVPWLVDPGDQPGPMSRFFQDFKESVARKALGAWKANAPRWLPRFKVREGKRIRQRFWQPGGCCCRIAISPLLRRLPAILDYGRQTYWAQMSLSPRQNGKGRRA